MSSERRPFAKIHDALRARRGTLAIVGLGWGLGAAALTHTRLREFALHRVVRPVEFALRGTLGRTPAVSPHLKILALDDRAAAQLGGVRLTTAQWAQLLRSLASARPRAILIDSMFSSRQDVDDDRDGIVDLVTAHDGRELDDLAAELATIVTLGRERVLDATDEIDLVPIRFPVRLKARFDRTHPALRQMSGRR